MHPPPSQKAGRLEKITTLMGLIGHLSLYIQAFKIYYLKSSYAISFIAIVISFISMVSWLLYGLEQQIKPLIISNIFGLIGISFIIGGILRYGCNLM